MDEAIFQVAGYLVNIIGAESLAELQNLVGACGDLFEMVTGFPPDESAVQELILDRPPGRSLETKTLFGIWNSPSQLIGVLDIVRDYPDPDDWYIGLLLLHPDFRHQGIGRQVFFAFEKWAAARGAHNLFLGVVEPNQTAFRFWQSLGFEVVKVFEPQPSRHPVFPVMRMKRTLAETLQP